jgi:formamidopyrimidine-DNA glycosylase
VPELPEVETVARLLRPRLVGRTIVGARVRWRRTIGGASEAAFRAAVSGRRVSAIERRGKFLLFALERGGVPSGWLVGHLRMTGRMHVEPRSWDPGPFGKVELPLDDGRVFHFVDVRKFGRLVHARDHAELTGELGPEPLAAEFGAGELGNLLRGRRRRLKPLLLDQTVIAGLGNIYADEALFAARLHPLRRADRVTPAECARLHAAIRATLRAAIEREGSSFDTFYRTPEGNPGSYQDSFRVYGRTGEPCLACGAPIRRIVVGQRGTHHCPRCQRAPRR